MRIDAGAGDEWRRSTILILNLPHQIAVKPQASTAEGSGVKPKDNGKMASASVMTGSVVKG
jgi:hypothetical protein